MHVPIQQVEEWKTELAILCHAIDAVEPGWFELAASDPSNSAALAIRKAVEILADPFLTAAQLEAFKTAYDRAAAEADETPVALRMIQTLGPELRRHRPDVQG